MTSWAITGSQQVFNNLLGGCSKNKFFHMYSGDLKSGLVWITNGQKEVELQMDWILNAIWNLEAQTFEIQTNDRHFVKNHLKSGQKCLDFKWSSFWMVGSIAIPKAKAWLFEIRPPKSPDFKCFRILNDGTSHPHCLLSRCNTARGSISLVYPRRSR